MRTYQGSFNYVHRNLGRDLLKLSKEVAVPTWHAENVEGNDLLVSRELVQVSFCCAIPGDQEDAANVIKPQMPWAEEHFKERVSGRPLNPPPSAMKWQKPGVADKHRTIEEQGDMKYSHSYPERFWPKQANTGEIPGNTGIRFPYGDLGDVVDLLRREPLTRQAYLPVWFPEDTGAVQGERVPCTLGYHFMIRNDEVQVSYMIRSVDFVRHFRDDVYLAVRLAQWMRDEVGGGLKVGYLNMHIMSLHYFAGDQHWMETHYGE